MVSAHCLKALVYPLLTAVCEIVGKRRDASITCPLSHCNFEHDKLGSFLRWIVTLMSPLFFMTLMPTLPSKNNLSSRSVHLLGSTSIAYFIKRRVRRTFNYPRAKYLHEYQKRSLTMRCPRSTQMFLSTFPRTLQARLLKKRKMYIFRRSERHSTVRHRFPVLQVPRRDILVRLLVDLWV